jgi:phosphohistidine phosphatase SixA
MDRVRDLRTLLGTLLVGLLAMSSAGSARSEEAAWQALRDGAILLVRHAFAPGVGDPPSFRLDDCGTQRNLNEAGREQARRIGEAFRKKGLVPAQVLTSQWCRCRETAELAFPGLARAEPAFNSFFGRYHEEAARTAAAKRILTGWQDSAPLVVVTHHVNIEALTGVVAGSGEGVVVEVRDERVRVVGRITHRGRPSTPGKPAVHR